MEDKEVQVEVLPVVPVVSTKCYVWRFSLRRLFGSRSKQAVLSSIETIQPSQYVPASQ